MKKNTFFGLAFLVLFGSILAHKIDWAQFLKILGNVGYSCVVYYCFAEALLTILDSGRLRYLSNKQFGFWILVRTRILSFFVGNTLPGMSSAEIVRMFLLNSSLPGERSYKWRLLLLLLTNRICLLLCMGPLLSLALMTSQSLNQMIFNLIGQGIYPLHLLLLVLPFTPMAFQKRLFRRIVFSIFKMYRLHKLKMSRELYLMMRTYSHPKRWLPAVFISLLACLVMIYNMAMLGQAAGIKMEIVFWAALVPLLAFSSYIPLGLGAFGSQDLTLVGIAKISGQNIEPFVIMSLLMHFCRITASLPGSLFLQDLPQVFKKKHFEKKSRTFTLPNTQMSSQKY